MVILENFINKKMRKIKLLTLLLLQNCFPSFEPKKEILKEVTQNETKIEWIDLIGTLDQDFPDYIIIKKNNRIDTICEAHNIKDFTLKNNTITIKFLGTPKKYNYPIEIPEHIYEYNIKVDTIN